MRQMGGRKHLDSRLPDIIVNFAEFEDIRNPQILPTI